MCTRTRLVWNQKSFDALGFLNPRLHSCQSPYPHPQSRAITVRYPPYRPLGSIDHVPRRPLETRVRFRERLRCMCHVVWNRLSPNSRSHRLCLLLRSTLLLCPWADAMSVFTPFLTSSALLHSLRHDPPFWIRLRQGSLLRLRECATQAFTNPLYASSFTLTSALRIQATDEHGRKKEIR